LTAGQRLSNDRILQIMAYSRKIAEIATLVPRSIATGFDRCPTSYQEQNMHRLFFRKKELITRAPILALSLVVTSLAVGGDRQGVTEVLQNVGANWSDAQFSVDLTGLSSGEAVIDRPLQIEYEAAKEGYVSYLRVSSHGDMTLMRGTARAAMTGSDPYVVKPPLGTEQLIVLFSNKPLDALFSGATPSIEVGADRAHAQSFVHQLDQLKTSGVLLAMRKYHYTVGTPAGGTEYTTRGIVFQVDGARHDAKAGSARAKIPSRIEFEFDSDRLTDRGKRDLDEFGEALATKLSDTGVVLEGHTDSVGTDEYNLALSQRRAEAARRYLIDSFGLNQSRIAAAGKGKSNPVASNDSEAERGRNRRVDFIFSSSPSAP
jgi:outer membrane protein OmpA-like peptidoglycan-associated protein